MNNTIDFTVPVYTVIKEHPELKGILVEFGFKPLTDPAMLNTAGRLVNLNQGAKKIKADVNVLAQQLEWNGYDVKGVENV
ncbi:uncharacterized protein DUF1858 [Streptohalobacillus salinus]|uniref:Uncharacterized protein DUF1858 n=1 Tax=Streptohalobacillus salinus TaxID=621096 RepID=A0A2V3WKG7_9BACI|nr:DUF1858 domain-containing protein [Streptohalobacillus salinus]PXW89199.1 uncharacterized protein DUF1858 [Streptohalobacillus salinus]